MSSVMAMQTSEDVVSGVEVKTRASVQLSDFINRDNFGEHFCELVDIMLKHKEYMNAQVLQMGLILPTSAFFAKEETRYTNIFAHTYSAQKLAAIREVLQNSSDAGTSELRLSAENPKTTAKTDVALDKLEAKPHLVCFEDQGLWCPLGQYFTYKVCTQYFLQMNGSSKDTTGQADGGFGVGRFVILFCAPFWCMTVRHLLVLGHYNCFKVLCRRCWQPVSGAQCFLCHLHESDVPRGTTIYVNYKDLMFKEQVDAYLISIRDHYLCFCQVKFPIYVCGQLVIPIKNSVVVSRNTHFTVSQCVLEEDMRSPGAFYFIRTHTGVLMFSKRLWNSNSAEGYFTVELSQEITFKNFNQARQDLIGSPGEELNKFFSDRDGDHSNNDVDKDLQMVVQGACPHDSLGVEHSECAVQRSHLMLQRYLRQAERDSSSAGSSTTYKVQVGPLQCLYFFRNGKTLDNINTYWLPGQNKDQIYLLLAWTSAINRAFTAMKIIKPRFDVGFVFDNTTLAMRKGDSYFINPESLLAEIGDFKKSSRFRVVSCLLARAVHEVAHVKHGKHNAAFATCMTEGMAATLNRELSYPQQSLMKEDRCLRSKALELWKLYRQKSQVNQPLKKKRKVTQRKIKVLKKKKLLRPQDVVIDLTEDVETDVFDFDMATEDEDSEDDRISSAAPTIKTSKRKRD